MKFRILSLILTFFCITSFLKAQSIIINEVMSSNYSTISDEDGNYADWIELYNAGDNTINLLNYSLSDNEALTKKWIFPNVEINPDSYLLIFASGKNRTTNTLHTNFKISANGEKLWLRDSFSNVIDSLDSVAIPTDFSLGRNNSNQTEWLFYNIPTPGKANDQLGSTAICKNPIFSLTAGFFENGINLTLASEVQNAEIYYTLDGSTPNKNSNLFNSVISIDSTTVVKAICYSNNFLPSKIETKTYFINESTDLPIVSISTNPDNLWDDEIGIYVDGTNGAYGPCSDGPKNFHQDWERPVTIEFFESDKTLAFAMDCGMKIYGGCTRNYPQKSLALFARRKYGYKSINYPIFPSLPYDNYEALILRNSGDDYYGCFFRDALHQSIVSELDLETQAYRPSIVFLNGEYWGIHNIREKLNDNYLQQHKNIDPNNLDILEGNQRVVTGDNQHYSNMISFIENNDLSVDDNYKHVQSLMDTDNFIDYCVSQIYFDNTDWPGHNIKYWRSKENGKWRWLLFDTDFGFGLFDSQNYKKNTLAWALSEDGTKGANLPWSTFLLRKLLENPSFKNLFINTFADYSNTIFRSSVVNNKIVELSENIDSEIPSHIEKWGEIYSDALLYLYWKDVVSKMKIFANNRISHLQNHFINEFGLQGVVKLSINSNIPEISQIKINSNISEVIPWEGSYFAGNTITLAVLPRNGYKFIGWSQNDSIVNSELNIEINLSSDYEIVTIFEKDTSIVDKIVINEINYNSSNDFNTGDWLELANIGSSPQDLSGWQLKDQNNFNEFLLPPNTIIDSNNYLVLAEDTLLFQQHFPDVKNIIGNFNFKLSNDGEKINIFDRNSFFIDTLSYGINNPWPVLLAGAGNTIELNDPELDNAMGSNWHISEVMGGTPGQNNSPPNVTSYDYSENLSVINTFSLNQNYPNPFNPNTWINYSLASQSNVILKIFDVLGNEISTLVQKEQPSGFYQIQFDGSELSSGIYFYRLQANSNGNENFVETKKMLLLK